MSEVSSAQSNCRKVAQRLSVQIMRIAKNIALFLLAFVVVVGIAFWWLTRGNEAEYSLAETSGTDPVLAQPDAETIPTVGVAKPIGWGDDGAPKAAEGLVVNRFAEGLEHPRVMYTMPNGDVLVAEANGPARPDFGSWIADKIGGFLMRSAGAGVPSPNQLVLLRDADGDGVAEERHVLRGDLDSPSGIAWADGNLYVTNHDELLRFDYEEGATVVSGEPEKLLDLPAAGNHWMRNIALNSDHTLLYIAVGSATNIADEGLDKEQGRAAIHEYDLASGRSRLWGAGMRNPNGLAWNPWSGELMTTVNERDMLGSDLVPDYLTNVPLGVHYGWPWLYYGDKIDDRVKSQLGILPDYVRVPEYALGPHVAALGLVFTKGGTRLGEKFAHGAFVARHGSWNRKPLAGYDVVYVAFDERGNPTGEPVPVLDGFLTGDGETHGRPTWVAWDKTGALLVSDDTANIIWRVTNPSADGAAAPERVTGSHLPPVRELNGDPTRAFDEGALSPGDIDMGN